MAENFTLTNLDSLRQLTIAFRERPEAYWACYQVVRVALATISPPARNLKVVEKEYTRRTHRDNARNKIVLNRAKNGKKVKNLSKSFPLLSSTFTSFACIPMTSTYSHH